MNLPRHHSGPAGAPIISSTWSDILWSCSLVVGVVPGGRDGTGWFSDACQAQARGDAGRQASEKPRGREPAGGFRTGGGVSGYGDLAPACDLIFHFARPCGNQGRGTARATEKILDPTDIPGEMAVRQVARPPFRRGQRARANRRQPRVRALCRLRDGQVSRRRRNAQA